MNIKDKLEQETINKLSEASYSRIYQHTQDDSTFAIIGSEDKDTGKNRKRELYDLLKNYKNKSGLRLGFNQAKGVYTYQDNNQEKKVAQEDSLIIYDIDKQGALDIANAINVIVYIKNQWKRILLFFMDETTRAITLFVKYVKRQATAPPTNP